MKNTETKHVEPTEEEVSAKRKRADVKRVARVELDTLWGQELADRLCLIAPLDFSANNWKGKLTACIDSNSHLFLRGGCAVGLFQVQRLFMRTDAVVSNPYIQGIFLLMMDEHGDKYDGYDIVRVAREWAKSMSATLQLPPASAMDINPFSIKSFFKGREYVENVI